MVKLKADDAYGRPSLASLFSRATRPSAPRPAAQPVVVISDNENEQPPSKKRSTTRLPIDAQSVDSDDEPPTKKPRKKMPHAPMELISPAKPAAVVLDTVTTTPSKTVTKKLKSKAIDSFSGVTYRLASLSEVTKTKTVSKEITVDSRHDISNAPAQLALDSVQSDVEGDPITPDYPGDWTDAQKKAHDTVIAAFKKHMPEFSEPEAWLKCSMPEHNGNAANRISRGRPPGAEFAAFYEGECKEAMLALPMTRQKAAAFAWEFMTVHCGYKGDPCEVGKAPTQELVDLLRETPCIPAYYCNDQKLKTFRGPLATGPGATDPQYDAGLWPDSTICSACNRCHNNTNVRMSVLLLLGIEHATPEEIGKHSLANDELSHMCAVAGCIIHARWEPTVRIKNVITHA